MVYYEKIQRQEAAPRGRRDIPMEYNKPIANIGVGDEVEGFYILKVANAKTSNSGKPFLAATLADKTGNIEAKVWDYGGPVGPADEGKVIKVRGQVSEYRGTLQIILSRIRTVQAGDVYDPGNLVPAAPIDPKAAYQELLDYVDSIGDPDYAAVCRAVLERYGDRFRTLPGGKSMHHGFIYGLVMHTLNMVRTADYLGPVRRYGGPGPAAGGDRPPRRRQVRRVHHLRAGAGDGVLGEGPTAGPSGPWRGGGGGGGQEAGYAGGEVRAAPAPAALPPRGPSVRGRRAAHVRGE